MKKLFFAIAFSFMLAFCSLEVSAAELNAIVKLPDATIDNGLLSDGNYSTTRVFSKDQQISITASDESKISGLYIIWNDPVKPWNLTTDNGSIECGKYGFIHEYIKIDTPSSRLLINIPANNMDISEIRIFSEGELPSDVQVWNPPCEKADIMLVSSHADDEILFFGGIIPTYAVGRNATIQVVYMTEFWSTTPVREHEKLDGLWESGLNIYPVCLNFYDVYSSSLAQAETQYSLDALTENVTEQLRRFKPQVVVTHDFNGEYGHGFHMITAKAVSLALEAATDSSKYPDQVSKYGIWDTPKTYIHLYEENKIRLDLRQPIAGMNNQTALDIAKAAYKKHVSQQWCWFYVSDDYQYSCADFGLYRTKVGVDTNNDMLCNLKTYAVQKAEEESIQASIAESISQSESISRYEEESSSIEASIKASSEAASIAAAENEKNNKKQAGNTMTIILAVVFVAAIIILLESWHVMIKRKRR